MTKVIRRNTKDAISSKVEVLVENQISHYKIVLVILLKVVRLYILMTTKNIKLRKNPASQNSKIKRQLQRTKLSRVKPGLISPTLLKVRIR